MIYLLLLLAFIAVACCLYDEVMPVRWERGKEHPWLLYGSDGSVKIDFTHPRIQKRIRDACDVAERIKKHRKP